MKVSSDIKGYSCLSINSTFLSVYFLKLNNDGVVNAQICIAVDVKLRSQLRATGDDMDTAHVSCKEYRVVQEIFAVLLGSLS